MKKFVPLILGHWTSSLGTALFLNMVIGVAAGQQSVFFLATVQILILLPSIFFSTTVGRLVHRFNPMHILIATDLAGVALMTVMALSSIDSHSVWLLIGAAICTVTDFAQSNAKNVALRNVLAPHEHAQITGLFQFAQAINLLLAPLAVSNFLTKCSPSVWPAINAISYALSLVFLLTSSKSFSIPQDLEFQLVSKLESKRILGVSQTIHFGLMLIAMLLGGAGVLIPWMGARSRGTEGALILEFAFAAGIVVTSLFAAQLWSRFQEKIIYISSAIAIFCTVLIVSISDFMGLFLISFLYGIIPPALELSLVMISRMFFSEQELGSALASFSARNRIGIGVGIAISSLLLKFITNSIFI
jgi:hypothetical protein